MATGDNMESFIFSLVTGHLFSKGVDAGQNSLEHYLKGKDLARILDEFDQAFMAHHDAEISRSNCDMQAMLDKRGCLISCAERYFSEDNSDVKKNLKQGFIHTACGEVGDSSDVAKMYLNQFYALVFAKETDEVSAGFRALLNAYADSQHEINKKTDERFLWQNERINQINKALEELRDKKTAPVDFSPFYQVVEESFTEEKDEESIVGNESDERAYIDAYIEMEGGSRPVLPFLEVWFEEKNSGAMLIHGEPGHGKTLLCRKAMVDFFRGDYLKGKAENVIAVSLNTGENRNIIDGGEVIISNALAWGAEREHKFTFDDCRGSLLFLDGFDEFIDDAKRTNSGLENICPFMKRVNAIAKSYDMHIVVTSRTAVVSSDLNDLTAICNHYELSPISESQQDGWMECHPECSDYKETIWKLRENDDMKELLGVPLLFRLIVYSRFDKNSSNVVELYSNLFSHLMRKRNIYADTWKVERDLMGLAFDVYCTDTNMAVLKNMTGNPHWLFTFYVRTSHKGKIGFFHRTFYQYFLAKFIYTGILNLKENEEANFIGMFAERELDETVRKYLSLLINEEDKEIVFANVERLVIALARTEAYLNLKPRIKAGDAEKSKILRSTNIYRNTLHLAAAFSYVIHLPFKGSLDCIMRTFDSRGITIISKNNIQAKLDNVNLYEAKLTEADLRGARLRGADLRGARLRGADLIGADLREAHLTEADLSVADLRGADLSEADLSEADLIGADLSVAYLSRADLRRAHLIGADLSVADLRGADLRGAHLSRAYLIGAYLSRAHLIGADLRGAHLSEADLSGAHLIGAYLSGAHLSEADLSGANLRGADLRGADLIGTDLSGAIIEIRYKDIIDLSSEGYNSIRWVTNEDTELL